MRIAVLMSTYNGEKYLREQVESILKQKGTFELSLIVRDDGSKDSTCQILDAYASEGKLTWYTGENLRSAHSFLDLIQTNTGYDFYAFADQDDWWEPDKLQKAVDKIKDEEKPALYFSNAELVDESLQSLGQVVYKHMPRTDFCTITCVGGLLGCTMVFNQALAKFIQNKGMPGDVIMHDYYIAVICAAMQGTVVYDPYVSMKYRQHANNVVGMSHGMLQKIKNRFADICRKAKISIAQQAVTVLGFYSEEMPEESRKWLLRVASYRKSIFSRLSLACTRKTKYISYNMGFKLRMTILFGNR